MDDAFGMGRVEGVSNLDREREEALSLKRLADDHVLESNAFEILHGDECPALLFANVVDRANVGMVQRRSRLSLTLKTSQRRRIVRQFSWKKFQRDKPVQACVLGL